MRLPYGLIGIYGVLGPSPSAMADGFASQVRLALWTEQMYRHFGRPLANRHFRHLVKDVHAVDVNQNLYLVTSTEPGERVNRGKKP